MSYLRELLLKKKANLKRAIEEVDSLQAQIVCLEDEVTDLQEKCLEENNNEYRPSDNFRISIPRN